MEKSTHYYPRFYLHDWRASDSYLCGFCDASNTAYAAVIYLIATQGELHLARFVTSKTQVAPIKAQTIPRLELIGALLISFDCHCSTESEGGDVSSRASVLH